MFFFLIPVVLAASQAKPAPDPVRAAIREIAASGVVLEIAQSPSARVTPESRIAPGAPPLLAFRYLEGSEHHSFHQLNLVIDDVGH